MQTLTLVASHWCCWTKPELQHGQQQCQSASPWEHWKEKTQFWINQHLMAVSATFHGKKSILLPQGRVFLSSFQILKPQYIHPTIPSSKTSGSHWKKSWVQYKRELHITITAKERSPRNIFKGNKEDYQWGLRQIRTDNLGSRKHFAYSKGTLRSVGWKAPNSAFFCRNWGWRSFTSTQFFIPASVSPPSDTGQQMQLGTPRE